MKVLKIDRATNRIIGSDNLSTRQFNNRALNKSIVALPVEETTSAYDPTTHKQKRVFNIPDLSDLRVDVPANAKITITYNNVALTAEEATDVAEQKKQADLKATNREYVEVLDNLIDTLIAANVITFDQLSARLQAAHNKRRVIQSRSAYPTTP